MDAVEDYARKWAKKEREPVETLSDWIRSIKLLIQARIRRLRMSMSSNSTSIFDDPQVVKTLSDLHDKYVIVPADKAPNNIVFVCKRHYIDCLIKEMGMDDESGNPTYTLTTIPKEDIINNHISVLSSFGVTVSDDNSNLPSIYWIPKLHKCPYKQRYIAGSARCTTKPLSILLTSLLTAVKDGLKSYHDKVYSTSGVNQMWILKNSKDLLEYLSSDSLTYCSSIKTFDFSTLYTTLPHDKLKSVIRDLIHQCFWTKKGEKRYTYLVVGKEKAYFVRNHTDSTKKYSETDVVSMLEFFIDNIFVEFGGHVFQQTVGIPMGTNCAPLLADLFLHSYEAKFLQELSQRKEKKLAQSFNFSFRYIDDVLSINNPNFKDYLHLIYPNELEIKETTETSSSASYLDLYLYIDNGRLKSKLYDKRDDFDFPIVNFPFLSSNIPTSPAYGVYISQLIRYSRACDLYSDFLNRAKLLSQKLLSQGYVQPLLISSLQKFYGRHHDLIDRYDVSISQMKLDIFV